MKFRWQKSGQLNGALEDLHFVILAIVEFPWVTFPCIRFITNVTLSQTVPIVYLRCYIFFKHPKLFFYIYPGVNANSVSLFTSNFVSDFVIHLQQFHLRFRYSPAILSQISLLTSNFIYHFQNSIFLCVFVSFKENILLLSVDCWEDKFWCAIKL